MGRPTLPIKSPKRLGTARRRSAGGRPGSTSSAPSASAAGVSANIRVAVRVRPENSREKAGHYKNVIKVVDEKMLVFDPKDEGEDDFYFQGKKQGRRDLNKKENKDQKFAYDSVFAPGSTNDQVFEGTTKDLVEVIFNGYNCSVFAYGATGAGKTFTMLGSKDCPGITFLTMQEIYKKIESLEDKSCEIGISYLEVYNETVIDLLSPGAQLNIRENGSSTTIPGLSIHKPTGPDHILSLLSFGNSNRTQHATDANSESSRSHAVLQVFLRQKDKAAGLSSEVKLAKMSLIDLAGSEKGCVTGNKGARFREGSNINKSLLALGNCINALADGSKYIPYRNSKLTRLLKDSIGGNCRTVMIANVSPSSETFEDTFNTLKYADRAKKIKINLKKNVVNVDFHIAQYAKIVEDLRGEIVLLKEKIQELENENQVLKTRGGAGNVQRRGSDNQDMEVDSTNNEVSETPDVISSAESNSQELDKLQRTLNRYIERQKDFDSMQVKLSEFEAKTRAQAQQIELLEINGRSNDALENSEKLKMSSEISSHQARIAELEEAARVYSEGEGGQFDKLDEMVEAHKNLLVKLKNEAATCVNLKLRIHFKKQLHERNDKLTIIKADLEKSTVKTAKAVESLEKKLDRKELRRRELLDEVKRNKEKMDQFLATNPTNLRSKNAMLEIQLMESRAESQHLFSMISTMGSKIEAQDTDLNNSLQLLKKNHTYLMGHEIATQRDRKEFEDLRDQLLERQLKWSENLNEYSDKDPEILAIHIYNEAAMLDLPSLEPVERPKSVEQKVLFEETIVGGDTTATSSIFNNDTIILGTTVENHDAKDDEPTPAVPKFPKFEYDAPAQALLPPTPNLKLKHDDEMLPETPRIFANLKNSSLELLPATPQLKKPAPPLIRKESDKSFLAGSPTPPLLRGLKSAYDPEPSTPKRRAEEVPQLESASKKSKLDDSAEVNPWAGHRETCTIPTTPTVEVVGPEMNETFEALPSSPTEQVEARNLNETVTLVNKLDTQCELNSPVVKVSGSRNLNSTFAVDEEPMDIDSTSNAKMVSSSYLEIANMSVINPPRQQSAIPRSPTSPVRAGMGMKSPTMQPKSFTPSPIRQSTLLDMKAPQAGGNVRKTSPHATRSSPRTRKPSSSKMAPPLKTVTLSSAGETRQTPGKSSTTPQPVRKNVAKRSLTTSVSTSVLPRPGQPTQPPSFRSTIARLNQDTDVDTVGKNRLGGTMERRKNHSSTTANLAKENPGVPKGLSSVTNKLGTGFGKLRKSVSSNVLKTTNKN